MAAEPIIALIIVVHRGCVPIAIVRFRDIGYVNQGDLGITGREAFELRDADLSAELPAHHLYVCQEDSEELLRQTAFRDYLRESPLAAERLSELKMYLARRCGGDRQAYMAGKSAMVQEMTRRAVLEASHRRHVR